MGLGSPFRMDPSDTRESFNSPHTLLSGPNGYPQWRRSMARQLKSKGKLGFVDGTIKVPSKDHRHYGAWKKCNDMVVSWIVKSVSSEIASSVRELKDAVTVWRKLKKRFSPGDHFMILDILQEIHSFRQEKRDVGRYFKEFHVLWGDLELIRPMPVCKCESERKKKCCCVAMKEQREQEKVGRFLMGLDDQRFDGIRSRIMRKEGPLPSLDQVLSSVFQEETSMVSAPKKTQSTSTPSIQQVSNNTPPEKTKRSSDITVHSIHPHPLKWKPANESYTCSGCNEVSFGSSYRCESCNFILDEDCGKAVLNQYNNNTKNSPVSHPFFKRSKFCFREKPIGYPYKNRYCDGCTKDIEGFQYHCYETDLDLHSRCFNLNASLVEGDVTLNLHDTIPSKTKCGICKKRNKYDKKGKGWCYVSSKGDYCYHVSCFKELVHEKIDFFKQELLSSSKGPEKKVMVTAGGSSSLKSKVVVTVVSVVVKLIFSIIFGNPAPLVVGLLDAVFNH